MPNQEISLARIPIRTGTQRNDLVFYNMYFWKTSPIGIGIWDIFHFSEIRLGLCNTWWMCSHEMLKKCLCWQRSGSRHSLCCAKWKKTKIVLVPKIWHMLLLLLFLSEVYYYVEQPIWICFWFYYIILDFIILFKRKIKSIVLLPLLVPGRFWNILIAYCSSVMICNNYH